MLEVDATLSALAHSLTSYIQHRCPCLFLVSPVWYVFHEKELSVLPQFHKLVFIYNIPIGSGMRQNSQYYHNSISWSLFLIFHLAWGTVLFTFLAMFVIKYATSSWWCFWVCLLSLVIACLPWEAAQLGIQDWGGTDSIGNINWTMLTHFRSIWTNNCLWRIRPCPPDRWKGGILGSESGLRSSV